MAEKRSWNKSLDVIKTVAIITVLMTHVSAALVILFPVSSPEFISGDKGKEIIQDNRQDFGIRFRHTFQGICNCF